MMTPTETKAFKKTALLNEAAQFADLDDAIAHTQAAIGQDDGGLAGMVFSDWDEPQLVWEALALAERINALEIYLEAEAAHGFPLDSTAPEAR